MSAATGRTMTPRSCGYGNGGSGARTFGGEGLFATIIGTYNECLEVSLDALTGIGGEIAETGEGLRMVSRNIRAAESTNVESFESPTWR